MYLCDCKLHTILRRILLFLLFLNCCYCLAAQDVIVIGQVLDASDQMPVEAASVWFKGTDIGTQTNDEGYFVLRAQQAQEAIVVSIIGYQQQEVRLQRNVRDQMVHVLLKQQINFLNEVIIMPGENPALPILRKIREYRHENNPELLTGFSVEKEGTTHFYMTNVRQKTLQRRLFRKLQQGAINKEDSSAILPFYIGKTLTKIVQRTEGVEETELEHEERALDVMLHSQLTQVMYNYIPTVNFYKNHIVVLNKNFISPLAAQGTVFYDYFLIDSLAADGTKEYHIRFRPKNDKALTFSGSMWIDGLSYALKQIEASMPYTANINYLTNLTLTQSFAPIDSGRYYYANTDYAMGFQFNFKVDSAHNFLSAILDQTWNYSQPQLLSSGFSVNEPIMPNFKAELDTMSFARSIDSLNQTKLQHLAYTIVDFVMNGYLHVGKLDIGPVVNMIRFNPVEKFRPTLSLRTGEKMLPYFTVGGYVGYGFGDREWKYGGELQFKTGAKKNHTWGLFYDKDVVRMGYQDAILLHENMVGSNENLLTSLSFRSRYTGLLLQERTTLNYKFETSGFRLSARVDGTQWHGNDNVVFIQKGQTIPAFQAVSLTLGLRWAFRERSIDYFFHRYYLSTPLPIINLQGEYGYYQAGSITAPYGKVKITVKQTAPLAIGRLSYAFEAGHAFGAMPYPLLQVLTTQRGGWYNAYNFDLLNKSEFITDSYLSLHLRYHTNGLIFNYIPWVKKFNLREEFIFKMAYGGLRDEHNEVFKMPVSGNLQTPYIEMGVGISNILQIAALESIWQVTHRHDPNSILWGLRLRLNIGF